MLCFLDLMLIMTRFEVEVTKLWQKIKVYHFLEIVQYTCSTTFLYQNLIREPKKTKMQIYKYFSYYAYFFMTMYRFDKRT